MTSRYSPALKSIALLVMISMAQSYVLANPGAPLFGRLVTNSDSVVIVNGNEALSGTTIFSGARLQTPSGVTASVQLGSLGRVDLSPGTTLTLSFREGNVAVEVSAGRAYLFTGEGVNGTINSPEGEAAGTGLEPGQSDIAAVRACIRAADLEYRRAVAEARGNLLRAQREAEANYRAAMRAAKTEAERRAAQMAKREAIRKAQLDARTVIRAAQLARQQAAQACRTPQPSNASNPSNSSNLSNPSFTKIFIPGLGIITGSMFGATFIPCRRGRNPSPGAPRGPNDDCDHGF